MSARSMTVMVGSVEPTSTEFGICLSAYSGGADDTGDTVELLFSTASALVLVETIKQAVKLAEDRPIKTAMEEDPHHDGFQVTIDEDKGR